MEYDYKFRIREILYPSLVVVWITLILYNLAAWLFTRLYGFDLVRESDMLILSSIGLPAIVVFIILKKRIYILTHLFGSYWRGTYQVFLCIMAVSMLFIFNKYVDYTFTRVQPIDTLGKHALYPHEKYYQISNFEADTAKMRYYITSRKRRFLRYNIVKKRYIIETYVIMPFKSHPHYWYVFSFSKDVWRVTPQSKLSFLKEIKEKLQTYDYQEPHRFRRVLASYEQNRFIEALPLLYANKGIDLSQPVFLTPVDKYTEDNMTENKYMFWIVFFGGTMLLAATLYFAKVDTEYADRIYGNKHA